MNMNRFIKLFGFVNLLILGFAPIHPMESTQGSKFSKYESTNKAEVFDRETLTNLCIKKIDKYLADLDQLENSNGILKEREALAQLPETLQLQIDQYYCKNHAFSNKQRFTFPVDITSIEIASDETFVVGKYVSNPSLFYSTADDREIIKPYTLHLFYPKADTWHSSIIGQESITLRHNIAPDSSYIATIEKKKEGVAYNCLHTRDEKGTWVQYILQEVPIDKETNEASLSIKSYDDQDIIIYGTSAMLSFWKYDHNTKQICKIGEFIAATGIIADYEMINNHELYILCSNTQTNKNDLYHHSLFLVDAEKIHSTSFAACKEMRNVWNHIQSHLEISNDNNIIICQDQEGAEILIKKQHGWEKLNLAITLSSDPDENNTIWMSPDSSYLVYCDYKDELSNNLIVYDLINKTKTILDESNVPPLYITFSDNGDKIYYGKQIPDEEGDYCGDSLCFEFSRSNNWSKKQLLQTHDKLITWLKQGDTVYAITKDKKFVTLKNNDAWDNYAQDSGIELYPQANIAIHGGKEIYHISSGNLLTHIPEHRQLYLSKKGNLHVIKTYKHNDYSKCTIKNTDYATGITSTSITGNPIIVPAVITIIPRPFLWATHNP